MSTKLTKAQLLARIDTLEQELGLAKTEVGRLARELDAYHYSERPSRSLRELTRYQSAGRQIPAHFAAARELAMRTGSVVRC
jgi:hypothetical protein